MPFSPKQLHYLFRVSARIDCIILFYVWAAQIGKSCTLFGLPNLSKQPSEREEQCVEDGYQSLSLPPPICLSTLSSPFFFFRNSQIGAPGPPVFWLFPLLQANPFENVCRLYINRGLFHKTPHRGFFSGGHN